MPINVFGDLKVVASNDIGSLGETTGPSVGVTWWPLFTLAQMVPFLFILALMFLRANRCSSAWWVWLPLLGTSVILAVLASLDWKAPGEIIDILQRTFGAVIMGLAVLWLLAPYFGRLPRGLGSVGLLLGVGVFGAIDVASGMLNHEGTLVIPYLILSLIFVAVAAVHTAVTFLLASLHCRRRFGRGRFLLWLFIWMLATGLLIAVLLGLLGSAVSGDTMVVFTVTLFIASVSVASFVVQLPLYLLAFFHPFYRERFLKLLVPPPTPPVPPPPPPAATTA